MCFRKEDVPSADLHDLLNKTALRLAEMEVSPDMANKRLQTDIGDEVDQVCVMLSWPFTLDWEDI